MRIGGPVFGDITDPRALVDYHLQHGFAAAYCPQVEDRVHLEEIKHALAERNIVIAELGAYCINILDTDPTLREQNITQICRRLEYAESAEALCCVIHGGTIETGGWGKANPENISQAAFDLTVAIIQRILDAVKPIKTKLVVEATSWLLPDSPEVYCELLEAVDRPGFGVHLDPVNILGNPRACYENGKIIRRCFELLGPYIVSCHSKDVLLRSVYLPIDITETYTGQSMLDYDIYLSDLSQLTHDPPLMIEHLKATELDSAVDFLLDKARLLGIQVAHADKRVKPGVPASSRT